VPRQASFAPAADLHGVIPDRLPDPFVPASATVAAWGKPGVVAFGEVHLGCLWRHGRGGATIGTVVVHGSTLVASGTSEHAGSTVWVSTDGSHWNTTLVAGDSYRGLLNGQVLVVFGDHRTSTTDQQDHPVLWVSHDASSWTRVDDAGLPSGQRVSPLGSGAGHYLAGGLTGDTATLWTSADGSTWTQAHLTSDVFPPGTGSSPDAVDFGVLLPMGGGIMLLGGVPLYPRNSPTFQPTAWLWAPAG
jgi:hypothetical protein